MPEERDQISKLVEEVSNSRKFKHVHKPLIGRIGEEELKKGRRYKEAVKNTKSKLHQVGAAYQSEKYDYEGWIKQLKATSNDELRFKETCKEIMGFNKSTRERLPILDDFYSQIFDHLHPINSVLDLACGLNPLAIPWMKLEKDCRYTAVDIYSDMAAFLNVFFEMTDIKGNAVTGDVLEDIPKENFDLAIMLKSIPCLEQIDKGAGEEILEKVNAEHILVSYPVSSLGGKDKGMLKNYRNQFTEIASNKNWGITEFVFKTELAYLIKK